MAHGEVATIEPAGLPKGSVITTSGRVSGVTEPGELSVHYPFAINDLVAIDDALKYGSRASNGAVRHLHRRPGQRHRRAGARDPGQGAHAQ